MRIYLTAPFDDKGVRMIETIGKPQGDYFDYWDGPDLFLQTQGWYRRDVTWHTSKRAALAAAAKFRLDRISTAMAEAARLSKLPPISIRDVR